MFLRHCVYISLLILLCSCRSGSDEYIGSLKCKRIALSPSKEIALSEFDVLAPRAIRMFGDIAAITCSNGDHNLVLIDLPTMEQRRVIHRGRGPGEMIIPASFHESDGKGILYDPNMSVCVSIDVEETYNTGEAVMDTIGLFSKSNLKPYYFCKAGEGFVSGNALDDGVWYSYFDSSGKVLSNVRAISFPEIQGTGLDFRRSLMLSSVYASSPDARKVCVANVATAALSFADNNGGVLTEYKRYDISPPIMISKAYGTVFSPDSKDYFRDIYATNDKVYLLYSGNPLQGGDIPSYEGRYVVEYDWDGRVCRLIELSHTISSFYLQGDNLIALTTFPDTKILFFATE